MVARTHARTPWRVHTKQRLCTMDDFPFAAYTISKRMHSTIRCIRARFNCEEEWVKHRKRKKKRKKGKRNHSDRYFCAQIISLFCFRRCLCVWFYGGFFPLALVNLVQFAKRKQTNTETMKKHYKFNSFRQFSHFVCCCCCF